MRHWTPARTRLARREFVWMRGDASTSMGNQGQVLRNRGSFWQHVDIGVSCSERSVHKYLVNAEHNS